MKSISLFALATMTLLPGVSLGYSATDINNPILTEVPTWFESSSDGSFYGETATGLLFTQQAVVTDQSVKMHKFTIAENFFYVTDKGAIEAKDDLEALSIYFSLS